MNPTKGFFYFIMNQQKQIQFDQKTSSETWAAKPGDTRQIYNESWQKIQQDEWSDGKSVLTNNQITDKILCEKYDALERIETSGSVDVDTLLSWLLVAKRKGAKTVIIDAVMDEHYYKGANISARKPEIA